MSSVSPILHALRWNPNDPLEVQADEVFAPTKVSSANLQPAATRLCHSHAPRSGSANDQMFSLACLLVGLVINCFNLYEPPTHMCLRKR